MPQDESTTTDVNERVKAKKSWWDRVGAISGVVIAGVGILATWTWNEKQTSLLEKQTQLQRAQVVRGFIPHVLSKDLKERDAALRTLRELGYRKEAFLLTAAVESKEKRAELRVEQLNDKELANVIARKEDPEIAEKVRAAFEIELPNLIARKENPEVEQKVRAGYEILSNLPQKTLEGEVQPVSTQIKGKEEWVYLGDYSSEDGMWRTRYLDFPSDADPRTLSKKFRVRKETGSLNVRRGMPDAEAKFPEVIDILKPGTEVTIQEVTPWQSTGFIWARISSRP
jgi:hypothetical protein